MNPRLSSATLRLVLASLLAAGATALTACGDQDPPACSRDTGSQTARAGDGRLKHSSTQ